jgi:hypothetical protein
MIKGGEANTGLPPRDERDVVRTGSTCRMRNTMRNNLLLFIGIGLAFGGSLLITGQDLLVQFGGILLGGVGAIGMIIGLFRGWRHVLGSGDEKS